MVSRGYILPEIKKGVKYMIGEEGDLAIPEFPVNKMYVKIVVKCNYCMFITADLN